MKNSKRTVRGRRRPSSKRLNAVLDQLAQWAHPGTKVRLVISSRSQLLHIIGSLHEDPSVPRSFNFHSLTGEIYVPLLADLCEAVRLESIGDEKIAVMENRAGSLSVQAFDLRKRVKPDAQDVEKACHQLSIWVGAKTRVVMGVYGVFFVLSIEGQLHGPAPNWPNTFDFTAAENLFRAAISPASAESVTMKTLDEGHIAIWIEGEGGRILLAEFQDKQAIAELLKASGGRVN